jgi:hypothetical protein
MNGMPDMMKPTRFLAVLLTTCLPCSSDALAGDGLPPPAIPADNAAVATLAHMPTSRLRLGALDIVLEETPLPVVKELLAAGAIAERGRTEQRMAWLCYTYDGAATRQRIWIIASGDFGDSDHVADGVAAEIVGPNEPASASCPALPAGLPVWLDRKVWLGISRDELVRRLGTPSQERDGILHFVYDSDVKLASGRHGPAEDYLVTSHLMVELRDDRVIRLWASKITSD